MPTPYPVKFKLPLEFLTLQDWNNFVQNLLFLNQYGSAQLLKYYQNGNFQNINDVIAKYLYTSALKVAGYNVLHNLSEPLAYTFGEGEQQPFESMANKPTLGLETVILPTLNFQIQLKPIAKQLELLIPNVISKIVTPVQIAGTQFQFSGNATIQTLIKDYLNPTYLQTWREITIQNLGSSAVQINNSIYLMPKNCLKITASSPNEIELTAQTPTLLSEEIEFTGTSTSTSITAYTITITNSQANPTPSPFQQLLNLDLSSILSSSSQLLNLEFCLDVNCNTPLYAWIESYNSNLSTVYIWINLPTSIPANSSIKIYMFVRNSIQYPYTGMLPTLTSTYAQYDNGENVFTFYDNFAGTSLNTNKWTSDTSNTTITVNNGLTIQSSGSSAYGGIFTLSSFPAQTTIFDAYLSSFSTSISYNSAHGIGALTGDSAISDGYEYVSWNNLNPNGGTITYGNLENGLSVIVAGPNFPTSNSIISGYWLSTGNEAFGVNYSFVSTTNSSVSNTGSNYYAIGAFNNSQSGTSVWYWARVRAYPPNGVMPSNSQPQKTIILLS